MDQFDRAVQHGTESPFDEIYSNSKDLLNGGTPFVREGVAPQEFRCADGFGFSLMAGPAGYCTPRVAPVWLTTPMSHNIDLQPNYPGPYSAVEVGFPTERPEPWDEWVQYCEDEDDPTETVYAYVPVEMVRALIDSHGGLA